MNRNAVRREVQFWLQQLGRTGCLGLGLVMAALAVWASLIHSGERELQSARTKLEAAQRLSQTDTNASARPALNREQQLEQFYTSFPKPEGVPDALKGIYKASKKHNLTLDTGEYTWSQNAGDRLARYRVLLPVSGTFAQLIAFMDTVMESDGRVALENASFKRDKVNDANVEAKLIFIVFVDTQP